MASTITGGASASPIFDAARWFADWSEHGGIAIHTGDHLYLSRLRGIDRQADEQLDRLRADMFRARAGEALAALLQARAEGGVA